MENGRVVKVVIAEGNPDVLKRLINHLSKDPRLQVVGTASNSDEACAEVRIHHPDVMVVEEKLKEIGGAKLTSLVRLLCHVVLLYDPPQGEGAGEHLRGLMRAGAADALMKPYQNDELVNSILGVAKRDLPVEERFPELVAPKKRGAEVIVMLSGKGGCGNTTNAIAIALDSVAKGNRTALVDFDISTGAIGTWLHMNVGSLHIQELVKDEEPPWDKSTIRKYTYPHPSGLDVIPSPSMKDYTQLIMNTKLEQCLEVIKIMREEKQGEDNYKVIVVDIPGEFSELTLDLMRIANKIIFTVKPDLKSIESVLRDVRMLSERMLLPIPLGLIGVVVALVEEKYIDGQITVDYVREQIEGILGVPVLGSLPRLQEVQVGNDKGFPYSLAHPESAWAKAIQAISSKILAAKLPDPREEDGILAQVMRLVRDKTPSFGGLLFTRDRE